jgi:hypothetical protein
MTYEKPEVRDFGSIAEHTYGGYHFLKDCFGGGSGPNDVVWTFHGSS